VDEDDRERDVAVVGADELVGVPGVLQVVELDHQRMSSAVGREAGGRTVVLVGRRSQALFGVHTVWRRAL
jgi:hypothetical protein